MVRADDALDLLLPGSSEVTLGRARRIVHFLRLLGDDARPARAASIGVDLGRARTELELQDRRRLEHALLDLLKHYLTAAAGPDTFAWFGEASLGLRAGWRAVDEFHEEQPWLAGLPEPDEKALSVAARLLESLARLGLTDGELAVWQARLVRVAQGPRAAEKMIRDRIATAGDGGGSGPDAAGVKRAQVACVAECLLDRGAVRETRAWLLEHGVQVEGDARLRHLLAWTRLCLDDGAGARNLLVGLHPWAGLLPSSLADLRDRRPEWLPCLAGRTHAASAERGDGVSPQAATLDARVHGPARADSLRDRAEIGASVLAVFAFRPGDAARPIHLDVAPALRQGVATWLADREGASAIAGEREHLLVVGARAVVAHRAGGVPLPGALGGETTLSLALVPVHDDDGEVAGWLHLECEHHLLPSRDRLARWAQAWRAEILAPSIAEPNPGADSSDSLRGEGGLRPARGRADECCAVVFHDLVRDIGIKTAQRRWWGFAVDGLRTRLVALGGEGAGLSDAPAGRRRALARALATGGTVLFDEPDARLSIDERAGSGVVLPLRAGPAICALLAIESSRRRDFSPVDLDRYQVPIGCAGLAMRLAQFRGWHQERFGFDTWFDASRADFQAFARHLFAAARTRSPVVLCGPPGSGKQILSRWIHFESRARAEPLMVFGCGSGLARGGIHALLEAAHGGSLLLDDIEDLAPSLQEELLRRLEGADRARRPGSVVAEIMSGRVDGGRRAPAPGNEPARILATSRLGLAQAVQAGRLRDDLAQRLDRLQLRVPLLRERREDILPLVACLARRFAREEGLRPLEFTDEALALLWRQTWEGNVRELESFVYKLVLLRDHDPRSAAGAIEPRHVLDLAERFSIEVVKRIPSRHPQRSDLLAALRVTRKPGGKLNKTRASAYLGWDPDTLVARMKDAGIGEDDPGEGGAWKSADPWGRGPVAGSVAEEPEPPAP